MNALDIPIHFNDLLKTVDKQAFLEFIKDVPSNVLWESARFYSDRAAPETIDRSEPTPSDCVSSLK